jgi:hypothetical protein
MPKNDAHSEPESVPPLLLATLHLDEAFAGFRRDLVQPFGEPASSEEHWTVWHAFEQRTEERSERAIEFWLAHRTRPPVDDDVAYFLCRRFDEASSFIQSLFLEDQTTIFTHTGSTLDDVLRWVLFEWWDAHGRREAYFADLEQYERKYEDHPKA